MVAFGIIAAAFGISLIDFHQQTKECKTVKIGMNLRRQFDVNSQ